MAEFETNTAVKTVSFSKKKYNEYKKYLETELGSELSISCCEKLCEIFSYNPNANTSNPEKAKNRDIWRKNKATELGVSIYRINQGIKNLNNQNSIKQ